MKKYPTWKLGKHWLRCSDARDGSALASLSLTYDVSVIDPPFQVDPKDYLKYVIDPSIIFGGIKLASLLDPRLIRFERVLLKRSSVRSATLCLRHEHCLVVQYGSAKTIPKINPGLVRSWSRQAPDSDIHEKPVELLVEHLTFWTPRWKTVLDPFAGSGSTLMAAEQMRRRSISMEIDMSRCLAIVSRWESATRKTARRIS